MVPPGADGDKGTPAAGGRAPAWPSPRRCGPSSLPQQATEPPPITSQVWLPPALTETKGIVGGVGVGVAVAVGVFVGAGVGVSVGAGVGVGVGTGVRVAVGVFVGTGVLVGVGVGVGVFVGAGVGSGVVPDAGGVAWSIPIVCPSRRRSRRSSPRRCGNPALTETKEPAGGVARPSPSLPQQATEPSLLTPQVWSPRR